MSNYKAHREPRRRGFDDDNYSPRDRDSNPSPSRFQGGAPSSSPSTDASVTWFNSDKGFGFVQANDGSEAFLHIRALEAAGHNSVPPGARLKVKIGQGLKGPQVMEVLEVDLSTAQTSKPAPTSRPQSPADGPGTEGEGTVKWYNAEKGFGFIGLDNGAKDVFVHATTVARSGLATLSEGQRLVVNFAAGKRGRKPDPSD